MTQKSKNIIKVVVVMVLLFLFVQYLLPDANSPEFKKFVESSSVLGPLAVISYIITAHVFAPLLGSPVAFLSSTIFGIARTMLFIYVAGLISSTLNFYISRKLGRKWVKKLAGEKNLEEIDKFLEVLDIRMLILGRVFGFAVFDIISYATGFTKMSFKKYFLVTVIFPLIPLSILVFVFKDFDFGSSNSLVIYMSVVFVIGVGFAFLFKRHIHRRRGKLL